MLPTAVGCSYNSCRFCMLFKHLQYRLLPLEQIRKEIDRVKSIGGDPKRVFLGDGNAFSQSPERLAIILSWIREAFPSCREVSMDSTVRDIMSKSDEDLRKLHELGVSDLYLGIECALEDVLEQVNKGNSLKEAEDAIMRLCRAGIGYDAHIMTGICGKGRGEENAKALAEFFERTQPMRICNFSLFLHRRSPLYEDVLSGRFTPADEYENLVEELCLLKNMEKVEAVYDGFHDALPVRVRGKFPRDKEHMCNVLREAIADLDAHPEKNFVAYYE